MTSLPPVRWTATEADYDALSWHDATLYGVLYDVGSSELSLDIDWLIEATPSATGADCQGPWICPATLVFHGVSHIQANLDWPADGSLVDISSDDAPTSCAAGCATLSALRWWLIKGVAGYWHLAATGFTQYVRRRPVPVSGSDLSLSVRGGVSFGRGPDTSVVA